MKILKILLIPLAMGMAFAQQKTVVEPDCSSDFVLVAAGSSPTFDNKRMGACMYWVVQYENTPSTGAFTALTMTFQSAPATGSQGQTAGTWITFAGTTRDGANPMTSTTSTYSSFVGYNPFVRVTLSGITGTGGAVIGKIRGWRRESAGASAGGVAGVSSINGTALQIAASASTGAVVLSIPTNPTLPGTTTGTFSGNLTGNVTGNVTGAVTGNASTATALAANPADCSAGDVAITIAASGALTCTPQYFFQGADTGGDDTYVLAPTNFPAAYVTGLMVTILVTTGNTGGATLDCGPGAKAIKLPDGTTDPTTGDIPALSLQRFRYDSTANAAAGAWIMFL